jgi:hypothetical protein
MSFPSETDITTGAQAVTTSGPVPGTLDVSGFAATQEFTISVTITGGPITVQIQDTAAGDFSDAITRATFIFQGTLSGSQTSTLSVRSFEANTWRIGATNNKLRAVGAVTAPGTIYAMVLQ